MVFCVRFVRFHHAFDDLFEKPGATVGVFLLQFTLRYLHCERDISIRTTTKVHSWSVGIRYVVGRHTRTRLELGDLECASSPERSTKGTARGVWRVVTSSRHALCSEVRFLSAASIIIGLGELETVEMGFPVGLVSLWLVEPRLNFCDFCYYCLCHAWFTWVTVCSMHNSEVFGNDSKLLEVGRCHRLDGATSKEVRGVCYAVFNWYATSQLYVYAYQKNWLAPSDTDAMRNILGSCLAALINSIFVPGLSALACYYVTCWDRCVHRIWPLQLDEQRRPILKAPPRRYAGCYGPHYERAC